jgi:hypothetical protein
MNDPLAVIFGSFLIVGGLWCWSDYRKGYGSTGGPGIFDVLIKKPTKFHRNILLVTAIGFLIVGILELLSGFTKI